MELNTFLWLGLAIVAVVAIRRRYCPSREYTTGFMGERVPLKPREPPPHPQPKAPQEAIDLLTKGRQAIADAHAKKLARAPRSSGAMRIKFTLAEHDQDAAWRALLNQADMRFGRNDVNRALREMGMSRW